MESPSGMRMQHRIECLPGYLYIQDMGTSIALAICISVAQIAQIDADESFVTVIDRMDREISGLLDAYLEGIPECPVRDDTPVRIWLLDLAWLRATGSIRDASSYPLPAVEGLEDAWSRYLKTSVSLISVFRYVRDIYSQDLIPDSSLSLELEIRLIDAYSLWQTAEAHLLNTYTEEDPR
jgi:hypothetical protein